MRLDPAPADEGPNEKESAPTTECGKAMHQMPVEAEFALESRGEAPRVERSGEAGRAGVEMDAQANAAVTRTPPDLGAVRSLSQGAPAAATHPSRAAHYPFFPQAPVGDQPGGEISSPSRSWQSSSSFPLTGSSNSCGSGGSWPIVP